MNLDTYVTPNMARYCKEYVDFCRELMVGADRVWIEEKVGLENYIEDGFGTVDFAALRSKVLHLVDLKYGQGVQVFASTPQAKYYSVALIDTYQLRPKQINSTIFQPRLGHIDTEMYTRQEIIDAAELFEWHAERVYEQDMIIKHGAPGEAEFNPGSHCGFCKAKRQCRALNKYIVEQGPLSTEGFGMVVDTSFQNARDQWVQDKADLMGDDELADYFIWCDLAARTATAIKYAATQRAAIGTPLKGLKLVAGRQSRDWVNTTRAKEFMIKELGIMPKDVETVELISPAQAEQLSGTKLKDHPLINTSKGKATLVTESDRRKPLEVQTHEEACAGFGPVE